MSARRHLDPELEQRVRGLRVRVDRAVEGLLSGLHKSPHRGASVVFVEHQQYRPGDDLRLLDWRAFARTDRHNIKRFEQESQLRGTLVLDRSASMDFTSDPSRPRKVDHAATLLAALAKLLLAQGDAAGASTIANGVMAQLPPGSRGDQLDALLELLAPDHEPTPSTDLRAALAEIAERAGRRGMVVIASDLLDLQPEALAPLSLLVARGNEVVVLQVLDPAELSLEGQAPARFVGLEGEPPVDADPAAIAEAYRLEVERFVGGCRERITAAGARHFLVSTATPPEETLATVLARPRRRGWGGGGAGGS